MVRAQEVQRIEPLDAMVEALEGVQDAVGIKDRVGRYLMVNSQAAAMAGRPPEEMLGRTEAEVFGTPGAERHEADLRLMERGAVEAMEEEPSVADGEMRTLLTTRTPLREASDEVIGLVAISTDITERKRLEGDLRDREALLTETQAIARVASWVWDVTDDSVTWSPEFFEMLGIRPGMVEPNISSFLGLIHPDDQLAAKRGVERALAGTDSYEVAHRLVRPDGAERMVLCRGRIVRDTDGSPLRMVGASLDLSDYMGIANELRSSHDQLVVAERLARSGSFEWDVRADRLRWSAGMFRVFGIRPDEFSAKAEAYYRRVHPDDRDMQRTRIAELLESGDGYGVVYRIVRGDGAVRKVRSDVSLERDAVGRARRLIGVVRDVTDED